MAAKKASLHNYGVGSMYNIESVCNGQTINHSDKEVVSKVSNAKPMKPIYSSLDV